MENKGYMQIATFDNDLEANAFLQTVETINVTHLVVENKVAIVVSYYVAPVEEVKE